MKYLVLLFIGISSATFAQSYKDEIAKHREEYKADFIKESRSPLREVDFKDLHFFDADSTFNIIGKVKVLKNEKVFKMPTYDGTSKEFIRYAKVFFKIDGKNLELTLYRNIGLMINPAYRNLLFLPFTDLTNNKTTYGGGRYIDLDLKDIKNKQLVIDFNKAYNPYCAYSDGYSCPIPPKGNHMTVAIEAGEKNFGKEHSLIGE